MPLQSKWVHRPRKYKQELESSLIGQLSVFADKERLTEFFELLKWKDRQNLVIWTLDTQNFAMMPGNRNGESTTCTDKHSLSDPLVAPFWKYVSDRLTSLVDPITGSNYEPLKSTTWWKSSYRGEATTKFVPDVQVKSILVEMYFASMKFKTVSEMIYQSNPGSLRPVVSYTDGAAWSKIRKATKVSICVDDVDQHAETRQDGWWISPDYDPYDVDGAVLHFSGTEDAAQDTCNAA